MPRSIVSKNKRGFTIIEVVLVLAIAGLIFLMVFIALPALQRSQRDTQRRNDYSMLSTAVTSYISNNGGKVGKLTQGSNPNTTLKPEKWINADGTDPNGKVYNLVACSYDKWAAGGCGSGTGSGISSGKVPGLVSDASQVLIITGASCNGVDSQGNSGPAKDTGVRAFIIYGYLESGGFYCQANNATK